MQYASCEHWAPVAGRKHQTWSTTLHSWGWASTDTRLKSWGWTQQLNNQSPSFSYLSSTIKKLGGTDTDIKSTIHWHVQPLLGTMRNIWSSRTLPHKPNWNSLISSLLLYGSETWRSTKASTKKLQVFIDKCLWVRRMLQLVWSDRVSNIELWQRSGQTSVEDTIWRRRWKWLGHTLQKRSCTIPGKLWPGIIVMGGKREAIHRTPGDIC